jgi:phage shock protein C
MESVRNERRISHVRFNQLELHERREERSVMESIHSTFHQAGLSRPQEGRVLAGVVVGLGRRLGLDPWPARLLFALTLLIVPGSQLLIYPVLWILMPEDAPAVTFGPATSESEKVPAA